MRKFYVTQLALVAWCILSTEGTHAQSLSDVFFGSSKKPSRNASAPKSGWFPPFSFFRGKQTGATSEPKADVGAIPRDPFSANTRRPAFDPDPVVLDSPVERAVVAPVRETASAYERLPESEANSEPSPARDSSPTRVESEQLKPKYLRSRNLSIPVSVSQSIPLVELQLWVSSDQGEKWRVADRQGPESKRFRFKVDQDGEYWLVSRTVDGHQQVHPETIGRPESILLIDTKAPELELSASANADGKVSATYSASDSYLSLSTVKLEYNAADPRRPEWKLAPLADSVDRNPTVVSGETSFLAEGRTRYVQVRLRASDLAGNATERVMDVFLPRVASKNDEKTFTVAKSSASTSARRDSKETAKDGIGQDPFRKRNADSSSDKENSIASRDGQEWPVDNRIPGAEPRTTGRARATISDLDDDKSQTDRKTTSTRMIAKNQGGLKRETGAATSSGMESEVNSKGEEPKKQVAEVGQPIEPQAGRYARKVGASDLTPDNGGPSPTTSDVGELGAAPVVDAATLLSSPEKEPERAKPEEVEAPSEFVVDDQDAKPTTSDKTTKSSNAVASELESPSPGAVDSKREELRRPIGKRRFFAPDLSRDQTTDNEPHVTDPSRNTRPLTPLPFESKKPSTTEPPQNSRAKPDTRWEGGEKPQLSNSKSFSLEYQLDSIGPQGVKAVELWGTKDGGQSWKKWDEDPDKTSPFDIRVDSETTFGFRVVVVGNNGLASKPPERGDQPDILVTIDTTIPKLTLLQAGYGQGEHAGKLDIRWTAEDEHLGPRPITLAFSESANGPFTTIASGLPNSGQYYWTIDSRTPRKLFLRIEAQDEAGNVALDQPEEAISLEGLTPRGRIRAISPIGGSASESAFHSPLFKGKP